MTTKKRFVELKDPKTGEMEYRVKVVETFDTEGQTIRVTVPSLARWSFDTLPAACRGIQEVIENNTDESFIFEEIEITDALPGQKEIFLEKFK